MNQYSTGGYTMTPMGPQIDPRLPVYKPEMQKGLLSDTKAQDLIKNFAGGLLGGYQVNATPNQNGLLFQPTNPSGVYTVQQTGAPDSNAMMQGGGNFTLEDILRMRGMGDGQFTAQGISKGLDGRMMAGVPFGAASGTDLAGTNWTGSDEQRALINSLLNYTPGE